jgi:hypothetical protein
MWDKKFRQAKETFNEEILKKRNKNIFRLFIIFISIAIVVGICSSIAYNSGFVPIVQLLEVKEPIGEAEEIDIDDQFNKYPKIREIPFIDKLKYRVYGTDKSMESVADNYIEKLENEGYRLLYDGIVYRDEIPYYYYGFLKGFTAVGIIMTSDKNVSLNHETMVLYTTGNALDYRNLLRWYKLNENYLDKL